MPLMGLPPPSRKSVVVVIDANRFFVDSLAHDLEPYFSIRGFSDSSKALRTMEESPPEAIVVNERIAPWGVLPLIDKIKTLPDLADIPILCMSESPGSNFFPLMRERGIVDAFDKPIDVRRMVEALTRLICRHVEASWRQIEPVQRSALVKTVAVFNNITDSLIQGVPLPYGKVRDSCEPLIDAVRNNQYKELLNGVQRHDNYSYVHSLRVATFLSLFGHKIGIEGEELARLATGGLLHDIGKLTIPLEILNKPGKLSDQEWAVMKGHVDNTLDYLSKSPGIPRAVLVIASQHHEKLNGSGYPLGLAGGELNDLARMATIVDIFGALTDRRVYKEPIPPREALQMMEQMGDALDQHFLALFKEMLLEAASLPLAA